MNTNIRQGTFEGFELPEVFLAAVQSRQATPGAKRVPLADASPVAPVQTSLLSHDDAPIPAPTPSSAVPDALEANAAPPENGHDRLLASLAATLIDQDRHGETHLHRRHADAVPELNRARATAFADTVDALCAVLNEQRTSSAAHARRMKTMLALIVCAMLVTVATGIAQTTLLMRMRDDTRL